VDIKRIGLSRDRLDDPGMAVADMRDIVVHVEESFPIRVIQPYAFSANNMQRLVVEQRRPLAEQLIPAIQ
jgi:hypothetical protein